MDLKPNLKHAKIIASRENITLFEAEPSCSLEGVITQDVRWAYHFERETKRQFM